MVSLCAVQTEHIWDSPRIHTQAELEGMLEIPKQESTLLIKLRALLVAAVITQSRDYHAGRAMKPRNVGYVVETDPPCVTVFKLDDYVGSCQKTPPCSEIITA